MEKLKADKIEEKSERLGFIDALQSLSKLENLEQDRDKNKQAIIDEEINLDKKIKQVNDFSLGKEEITRDNVATFLKLERLTILSIKKKLLMKKSNYTLF